MPEYTSIALLMVGVTFVFLLFSVFVKNNYMKAIFFLMTLLMIIGDFFFARTIVGIVAPTQTTFIQNIDVFYLFSMQFFFFVSALVVFGIVILAVLYMKDSASRKRQERSDMFMGL